MSIRDIIAWCCEGIGLVILAYYAWILGTLFYTAPPSSFAVGFFIYVLMGMVFFCLEVLLQVWRARDPSRRRSP